MKVQAGVLCSLILIISFHQGMILREVTKIAYTKIILGNDLLSVEIDESRPAYDIYVDGQRWLRSGSVALHCDDEWFTSEFNARSKMLSFKGFSKYVHTDSLGTYEGVTLRFEANKTPFHATIKVYSNSEIDGTNKTFAIFEQFFPNGAVNTSLNDANQTISSFPTLHADDVATSYLMYTTFQGLWDTGTIGRTAGHKFPGYLGGGTGGVPLILYDEDLHNHIVISPFNNFPVAYQAPSRIEDDLFFGFSGMVSEIPPNRTLQYILFAGSTNSITQTVYDWGEVLLNHYGKKRATSDVDILTQYLGYWTDNGAYYYYVTLEGMDYEQTMVAIQNYLNEINIPIHYFQLDSWWYYKGLNNGIKEWDARPDIFPSGMAGIHDKLKLPFALHNRYWSPDNVYQEEFPFIVESVEALPLTQDFWDYLMNQTVSYGAVLYEQDWLINQFNNMNATQQSVDLARDWLMQMGTAAQKYDLTIQYCMPLWSDYLQSVEIQAVSQIRSSDDYENTKPEDKQWNIGKSSLIAWSLGLIPFKDTFWTSKDEPENRYGRSEPNPELQTLVSVMSTGPVGPGDKIGYVDRDLLMRTCNDDGLLLKPDKPLTSIDRSYGRNPPDGEIWTSYSELGGYFWHYVMSADMNSPDSVTPSDLFILNQSPPNTPSYYFDYHVQKLYPFDNSHAIPIPGYPSQTDNIWPMDYFVVAPVLPNGFVVMGEVEKFATMSTQRFNSLSVYDSSITMQLNGVPNEGVKVWIASENCGLDVVEVQCDFKKSNTMEIMCKCQQSVSCECTDSL